MATGMRVSAVVALVAAIGVVFALPARRRPEAVALPQPAGAAARAGQPRPAVSGCSRLARPSAGVIMGLVSPGRRQVP